LCPANDVSGGAILRRGTRKVNSRAAKTLRLAAQTLFRSKTPLGVSTDACGAKLGGPKAVTAIAHKLARIIYHLIATGQAYDETTFAQQQARYRKHQEAKLQGKARDLGFQLSGRLPPGVRGPVAQTLLCRTSRGIGTRVG